MIGSFMYGASTSDKAWESKLERQRADIADKRADNAIDAGKRYGHYTKTDEQLEAAVEAAKAAVHEYYKDNPPDARVVEKVKLVPVPGKEEYVYVPIGTCPNDFLNADELRLWNLGSSGYHSDPSDPK